MASCVHMCVTPQIPKKKYVSFGHQRVIEIFHAKEAKNMIPRCNLLVHCVYPSAWGELIYFKGDSLDT